MPLYRQDGKNVQLTSLIFSATLDRYKEPCKKSLGAYEKAEASKVQDNMSFLFDKIQFS